MLLPRFDQGVRVENMSWSATAEEYEKALENYGKEDSAAKRREIAQSVFECCGPGG